MEFNVELVKYLVFTSLIFIIPFCYVLYERKVKKEIPSDYLAFMDHEEMPELLQKSELVMNEEEISIQYPIEETRRVDQVFKTPEDVHIILDTKTRKSHKVYDTDIFQISRYAYILRRGHKLVVANEGFIRTVVFHGGDKVSIQYHYVYLLPEQETVKKMMQEIDEDIELSDKEIEDIIRSQY